MALAPTIIFLIHSANEYKILLYLPYDSIENIILQKNAFKNALNPLNTLFFLKSLKILKKFKNLFLSFNGDRALPRTIQNVVLVSFESIFNALSTKPEVIFYKNQVVRSYGVKTRTHYLDLFRTHICVFRSLRVK